MQLGNRLLRPCCVVVDPSNEEANEIAYPPGTLERKREDKLEETLPAHNLSLDVRAEEGKDKDDSRNGVRGVALEGVATASNASLEYDAQASEISGDFTPGHYRSASNLSTGWSTGDLASNEPMTFSDFMTGWCELIWPKLAAAASAIVNEKLETAIEEAASHFKGLTGEIRYSVNFGNVAPSFDKIYSFKKQGIEDDGIEICGHMRWEADMEMTLAVGPVSIGINHMTLEGEGCVVATPLLPKDPIVGGMQLYFVNTPELKLSTTGMGSWTGVSSLLGKVAEAAFTRMMVLPHRMSVRFANTRILDTAEYKNPPPIGMLRIRLKEARDLPAADANLFSAATSDPYCYFSFGGKNWRSRTIKKNLNPVWEGPNDCCDFFVYHERQILQLAVYDDDMLSKDDYLGSLPPVYTVQHLVEKQKHHGASEWLDLELDTTRTEAIDGKEHRSIVTLKVAYFTFESFKLMDSTSPIRGEAFRKEVPSMISVKIYHAAVATEDPGKRSYTDPSLLAVKGAVIRLRVVQPGQANEPDAVTKKGKGIHPKEVVGFGAKQSAIMHNLYTSFKDDDQDTDESTILQIANAFKLHPDIAEEVVRVQETGKPMRVGWDETLYTLVYEPTAARVGLEIYLKGRWHAIGQALCPLEDFLEHFRYQENPRSMTKDRAGSFDIGQDNDNYYSVVDWPGSQLRIGISVALHDAKYLEPVEAWYRFRLGRLGGDGTKKGSERVESFIQRRRSQSKTKRKESTPTPSPEARVSMELSASFAPFATSLARKLTGGSGSKASESDSWLASRAKQKQVTEVAKKSRCVGFSDEKEQSISSGMQMLSESLQGNASWSDSFDA